MQKGAAVEIIDNFGLQFSHDGKTFAWMSDVVRQISKASTTSSIVRLNGERKSEHIEFELHNGQNKTQVHITDHGNRARALFFKRPAPDPAKGFRPIMERVRAIDIQLNWGGLNTLSTLAREHLEQDTPYSLGTITKVKVTPTLKPLDAKSFAGGQITFMEEIDGVLHLTIEGGKCKYTVHKDRLYGRKVAAYKYVLFNETGDFDFVGSNEFHFYFEMAHAKS